jgi:hypothetical protein
MGAYLLTRAAAVGMAALALLAGSVQRAEAQTITLDAADSGWYNSIGTHSPENPNYLTGRSAAGLIYNNFFVFDLSSITLPIASAELQLFNPASPPAPGYSSPDPREIYTPFDVSTAIPTLVAEGRERTDIFADLGSGVPYGSQVVSAEDNGRVVTIGLNPSGVADLNRAVGGLFAVGGTLTTLRPGGTQNELVFAATHVGAPTRQLVVTLIPEPGTLTLLGTGALGLLGCGRRRKRAD